MTTVKSFVRWLWRTEAVAELPRIMDAGCRELEIGKSRKPIEVFTKGQIASLLKAASRRTRLYILLTLNTAMTQKDIADLDFDEVVWNAGRVIRKRSKTRKFETAPTVSYKLWPETMELLEAEKHGSGKGRVLRNRNGTPLWSESWSEGGKYHKIDNVRSSFDRLRTTLKLDKSFKCLKKTAATELAASKEYRSVRSLYLGHAPGNISDRHYAAAPNELLDEALGWLRTQLGIEHAAGVAKGLSAN
jgi:integrase